MNRIAAIVAGETQCSICLELCTRYQRWTGKIFEHGVGEGKHSFHLNGCLSTWLQNHHNCPACRADLPPFHRIVASSEIKISAAAAIIGVAIPLLGINALADANAVVIGLGIAIGVGSRARAVGEVTLAALTAGTAVMAGAAAAVVAALPAGTAVMAGALAVGVVAAAAGEYAHIVRVIGPRRELFSAGAATAGVVLLSTVINGGGWPLGLGLAAISAASTYWDSRA